MKRKDLLTINKSLPDIKVVNAGNCMICGKTIKLAVARGNGKCPNIFFCRQCEPELKYDLKRPESDEEWNDKKEK